MEREKFEFIGGSICLDLANTVGGLRNGANASEYLRNYSDLLNWSHESDLISENERESLLIKSLADPAGAESVLKRVHRLREAIYQIFSSCGESMLGIELSLLNDEIAHGFQKSRIVKTPEGYAWGWSEAVTLDAMIAPIARSAADLLTSPPALSRVRECSSQTCSWLFIDETRNHSRRWCNMKTCGNVHKVNQFRARQTGNR